MIIVVLGTIERLSEASHGLGELTQDSSEIIEPEVIRAKKSIFNSSPSTFEAKFQSDDGPDDHRDASHGLEKAFLPDGLHDCLTPNNRAKNENV